MLRLTQEIQKGAVFSQLSMGTHVGLLIIPLETEFDGDTVIISVRFI